MAFQSTLMYYRPLGLPPVPVDVLANAVRQFKETGAADVPSGPVWARLRCRGSNHEGDCINGWVIDAENDGHDADEPAQWDIEVHGEDVAALGDALYDAGEHQVYCGIVRLGRASPEIMQLLRRPQCDENEECVLDSWSLQIGRIESGRDGEFAVGSIAVGVSGSGYPYPWTLRDLINRAEQSAGIQRVQALCRALWSVPPIAADDKVIAVRRKMGKYWPYERFDLHAGWYWGLQGLL